VYKQSPKQAEKEVNGGIGIEYLQKTACFFGLLSSVEPAIDFRASVMML